jgi:hypothetical protein
MRCLFRAGSGRGSPQEGMREHELMLERAGRCHGDADTADADGSMQNYGVCSGLDRF